MNAKTFKNVVISAIAAELAAFVLLLIFSFVTYKIDNPGGPAKFLGIIALLIGSAIAGFASMILTKERNLWLPMLSALIYLFIQLITSIMLGGSGKKFGSTLLEIVAAFAISVLCGYFAMPNKKKRSINARKRARSARR